MPSLDREGTALTNISDLDHHPKDQRDDDPYNHDDPHHEEMATLREEINNLRTMNERLEHTIGVLRDEVASVHPEPINASYSLDQFILALAMKLGRTYGWRTDYVRATKDTPDSHTVNTDDIQKWQREKRVPEWAYTQIEWLQFNHRMGHSGPDWSNDEVSFLVDEYKSDPHQKNVVLAIKCEQRFGRSISEQAIKGAVYRLGKQGVLPQRRSSRHK
jgi:hypothetical protein